MPPDLLIPNTYFLLEDGQASARAYSLRELIECGAGPHDFVWREGMTDWARASEVAELRDLLPAATAPKRARVSPQGAMSADSTFGGPADRGTEIGGVTDHGLGRRLRANRDLVLFAVLGMWLLADLVSVILLSLVDYGSPSYTVIGTLSSLLWALAALFPIALALLVSDPDRRPLALAIGIFLAIYGVYNALRYSPIVRSLIDGESLFYAY